MFGSDLRRVCLVIGGGEGESSSLPHLNVTFTVSGSCNPASPGGGGGVILNLSHSQRLNFSHSRRMEITFSAL